MTITLLAMDNEPKYREQNPDTSKNPYTHHRTNKTENLTTTNT